MVSSGRGSRFFLRGTFPGFVRFLLLALLLTAPGAADILEDQVKAAFLYNFTNFVEWPPHAWSKDDAPIIISIIGNDDLASLLEKTVAGRKGRGRSFQIQRFPCWPDQAAPLRGSHLVYIDSLGTATSDRITADLAGNAVLLVGNGNEFARRGGMIQFRREGDRIIFDINRQAAEKAGLKISSRLYKVARIIDDLPGGKL